MKRKMTKAEKDQFKRECLGIPADKKLSAEDQRFIDSYFQAVGLLMRDIDKKLAGWRKGMPAGGGPEDHHGGRCRGSESKDPCPD